jgi:hypothetical protein
MLLLANLYFLISLLPYCISTLLLVGQKADNTLGQSLVHTLMYTNNAVNFLLYGFSSQKYREELFETFGSARRKNNPTSFQLTPVTANRKEIVNDNDANEIGEEC